MNVTLLSKTENPEMIVAAAAKLCYSQKDADQLMNNLNPDTIQSFIEKLSEMGHESPFEHVSFTFSISGVSRALLAQITRHRIASYSVRSQRYVDESGFDYVVPDIIEKYADAYDEYTDIMNEIQSSYEYLVDTIHMHLVDENPQEDPKKLRKIAMENARYVLPNACTTNLVVTMNARSLFNFFKLRCCNRAQDEIHVLADKMLKICIQTAPKIFSHAGPSCVYKQCSEGGMSCGKTTEVREKYLHYLD